MKGVFKVLPAPAKDEKEKDFVSRFMSDEDTTEEFPNRKQRFAIAMTVWTKHKKSIEKRLALWGSTAGKTRLAKRVLPMIPEHSTYVEPFAGGAAIFYAKPKEMSKLEVLTDTNPEVAFSFKFIRDLTDEQARAVRSKNWVVSKEQARRVHELKPKNGPERFYRFAYKRYALFFGREDRITAIDPFKAGKKPTLINNLERTKERLKGVKVHNDSYEKVVKAYDSKDTFFYLDPPYPRCDQGVGEKEFDEPAFIKTLQKMKGKFLLHYDYRDKSKFLNKGWTVKVITATQTMSPKANGAVTGKPMAMAGKLLEVTNYTPTKKAAKPKHFGGGENIDVFGYETGNFDICKSAVLLFRKLEKTNEKETQGHVIKAAKYLDAFFGIEKKVVAESYTSDEDGELALDLAILFAYEVGLIAERMSRSFDRDIVFLKMHFHEIGSRMGLEKSEIPYADPRNEKYPIDSYAHVRAAISYFSMPKNADKYSEEEQEKMWSRIKAAAKKFDIKLNPSSGPPSVEQEKAESYVPPKEVQAAAAKGLELRRMYERGGLDVSEASEEGIGSGVQRATNLKNGDNISRDTIKRMRNFFSRHQANYKPNKKMPDGGPTAGTIAWLLWGGDPGKEWADSIIQAQKAMEASLNWTMPIIKKDDDERIVTGIVLEPDEVDAQGDTVSKEAIKEAAYRFLAKFNKDTELGFMHKAFGNLGISLVESWVAREDCKYGGSPVKSGSWLMSVKVDKNDTLWKKIKAGEISGFSIGGVARVS